MPSCDIRFSSSNISATQIRHYNTFKLIHRLTNSFDFTLSIPIPNNYKINLLTDFSTLWETNDKKSFQNKFKNNHLRQLDWFDTLIVKCKSI
jgi:hypothetical protein